MPKYQQIMEHLDRSFDTVMGFPQTVELDQHFENTKQKTTDYHDSFSKRSIASAKAEQVEETRRARHRAVQRRFVQRKKAEVERTKTLAQTLEKKYQCLELAMEAKTLQRQTRELQTRLEVAVASVPRGVPNIDPVQLLMQNQMELVKEFYDPLSLLTVAFIQQKVEMEYDISRSHTTFQSSGVTVMGWSDVRKVDAASVKFMLSKNFPNIRALQLMNLTWTTLSFPATYAKFFSPAFPIKTQIVQEISHDAVVLHRVLFNPHTQSSSNSLELLWRVRLGNEYVIFDSSLQHNAVQQCLGASYKWTQTTTSLGFTPLDVHRGTGCVFRHGGWIQTAVTNVDYWFMEMFFMALRFESIMVAPVFALPSNISS